MGHIRLGRLPKTARWREVVGLMESEPDSANKIAAATVLAAEDYLRGLARDPALTFTYWTLVRLMSAARGDDFAGELRRLGLPESGDTTGIEFFAAVAEHVREGIEAQHAGSAAGEMAALALRRALTETVATQSVGLSARQLMICVLPSARTRRRGNSARSHSASLVTFSPEYCGVRWTGKRPTS